MIKLVHIITGLDTGGTETMLYKLLSCLDPETFHNSVISLTTIGSIGEKIRALGVPVHALSMQASRPSPLALARLAGRLRQEKPHLIQTWMYHANLMGGIAAQFAGRPPVLWGIRQSNCSLQYNKRSTVLVIQIGATLSHWLPALSICCSEVSRQIHVDLGYAANKMVVIPNGFETDRFRPDTAARQLIRQQLGLADETVLIGLVGRFDPQKDHQTFFEAAALLHRHFPDVRFLLCGDGITWENPQLARWIEAAGVRRNCHLLGRRDDMPQVTAALDISALSSVGEAFPNVVGEAMACGVPCVVTDVGDAAAIVGETGISVFPRNPQALADAWTELILLGAEKRTALGKLARARTIEHFSLASVVAQYEAVYRDAIAHNKTSTV